MFQCVGGEATFSKLSSHSLPPDDAGCAALRKGRPRIYKMSHSRCVPC
jgi:hypothetical protein